MNADDETAPDALRGPEAHVAADTAAADTAAAAARDDRDDRDDDRDDRRDGRHAEGGGRLDGGILGRQDGRRDGGARADGGDARDVKIASDGGPAPDGGTADGDVLVDVRDLAVHFPIRRGVIFDRTVGYVYAVDGVSLTVRRGETYGLVGESGCGKTTFGRGLLRLVEPTGGQAFFDGTDLRSLQGEALRTMRSRMQMIFQDPLSSLDPRQSIESTLSEGLKAHGRYGERGEARRTLLDTLDAVGLPTNALRKYPHEFSGGQRQRIGIARALVLRPDLIVADEPVSALDVSVQAQVVNLLEDLQERFGLTYLVIAHDLAVVHHIADRVGVMYLGGLVEEASSEDLYTDPLHPYTRALMSAVPVPDPVVEDSRRQILLAGDLPSPAAPPPGCRFHTRCPWRQEERCDTERPVLREIKPSHRVACHYAEDIRDGRIQPHEVEAEVVAAGTASMGPSVTQTTAGVAGTLPPGH